MLHANRNGFFYVFDRRDGTLLMAKPFVKNLTWAHQIGYDGRPVKLPNQEPTAKGTKVCPSQDGATNWFSPSFNPATGLYYIQTFEKCSIYTKSDSGEWESGKSYLGGSQRTADDPKPERILKAIDIQTGAIAWTLAQRPRAIVGRHAEHRDRTGNLRIRRWRADGGGCDDGEAAVDVSDEPDVEGVADDLHVRRPPDDCDRGGL